MFFVGVCCRTTVCDSPAAHTMARPFVRTIQPQIYTPLLKIPDSVYHLCNCTTRSSYWPVIKVSANTEPAHHLVPTPFLAKVPFVIPAELPDRGVSPVRPVLTSVNFTHGALSASISPRFGYLIASEVLGDLTTAGTTQQSVPLGPARQAHLELLLYDARVKRLPPDSYICGRDF
jgi:hypothetical protein